MKVRLSSIPSEGLHIQDTLPLEGLNARMKEGREVDIVFTSPPRVDLLIVRNPQGAETKGKVQATYQQSCSRCSDRCENTIEADATLILQHIPEDEVKSGSLDYEDDIGISFFAGDQIDLEPLLQEALILSLSIYWAPPLNDKGDCQSCGANFTTPHDDSEPPPTISLGDLLKKAGVSASKKKQRPH